MARYPDYQVELSEPTTNKPTSLGLAKFQQAKPEKEPNLPLSPSLEAWLPVQAQTLEGKDTGMHEGTGGAPIIRNRCEIGADPWVMRIVQWGYRIHFVTLPPTEISGTGDHYPKESLSGCL